MAFDKKQYYSQRMFDKTISEVKKLNDFEKTIRNEYRHTYGYVDHRINKAFQIIASGYSELIKAIKQEPERTEEGVIDLSKV